MEDNKKEQEPQVKYDIHWTGIIVIGVIILLIVACVIVLISLGGPLKDEVSSSSFINSI